MYQVRMDVVGRAPLLMARAFSIGKEPPVGNPKWEDHVDDLWRQSAHFDPEIGVYIPAEAIEKALQNGGSSIKYQSRRMMKSVCESYVYVDERKIQLLEGGEPVMSRDDLEPFECIAGAQGGKKGAGKILRIRPIFYDWSFSCKLLVMLDDINISKLQETVQVAGMAVGLLSWRPRFGRFDATLTRI